MRNLRCVLWLYAEHIVGNLRRFQKMTAIWRSLTRLLVVGCLLVSPVLAQAHSPELEAGMKAF